MHGEAALTSPVRWTCPSAAWALLALAVLCLGIAFHPVLARLYEIWTSVDEYSHGLFVPVISLFLLWQRRDRLAALKFEPSWIGVLVLVCALAMGVLAHLATSLTLSLYAFLLALAGVALSFLGWRGFRVVAVPLAILFLTFPLPDVVFRGLSQTLQLLSSQLGVWLVRLAGVSVHLDGNVIDLGTMKLQVVEACSGLRYLFALVTLGVITACFFRGPLWQRVVLVLSTLPITLLMNSVRIAVVGVTVEYFGREAAEGVLHDLEGLAVFMGCILALMGQIWLFARLNGKRFRDVFAIDLPGPVPEGAEHRVRALPPTLVAAALVLAVAAGLFVLVPAPTATVPERRDFTYFPQQMDGWRGRPERLERQQLDVLQLDDYLLANYFDGARGAVNAYVAYYASQTQRLHDHSPRQCLPGGGWEIRSLERHLVPGLAADGRPLEVNRVVIQRGEARQLVYYWFKQRDRMLADEYQVKFYMVWDMLTRQRSDGALVRLVTPIAAGETPAAGDARLTAFAATFVPRLTEYVPQ